MGILWLEAEELVEEGHVVGCERACEAELADVGRPRPVHALAHLLGHVGHRAGRIPAQPDRPVLTGLSMDVDRSGGDHQGRIYMAFTDQGDLDAGSQSAKDNREL